jgi:signal transduction histidine kinase
MKFNRHLLVFLLASFTVLGQNSQKYQDSIKTAIKNISSDSLRAAEYYNAAIYAFQPLNNLKLSRRYVDSSAHYSQIIENKDLEAKCHFLYGVINRFEGDYDIAVEHLNKHIEHFKKKSIEKPYSLFQIAAIHGEQGDYENSLKISFKILRIFEREKDSFALASTYNSIATDYHEMGKIDESLINLKKALAIFNKLNKKKDIANTTRNIGEVYLSKHDTITGIKYIKESLKIANQINEPYEIGYSLYVLGTSFAKSQPKTGHKYLLQAKSLIEQGNYKSLLTNIYISLGNFHQDTDNNFKAINFYKKALKLAEELKELPPKKEIYKGLFFIYKQQGDFQKAFEYQDEYMLVKDSILNKENLKTISLLEKQYETEKKEKEIITLSEQKLKDDIRIAEQQRQVKWLVVTIIGVILLSVLLFLLFKQRSKNKRQNELIDAISETQNIERKRIAQDLHDSIGGSLALIKNKLEVVSDKEQPSKQDLTETIKTVSNTSDNLRRISHNLMPSELIKFGLVSGIQSIIEQLNKEELNAQLYAHNMEQRIDPVKEIQLYRIIQEIIQNALKHANAKNISISLNKYAKHLNLMIEDDGNGFDITLQKNKKGIGLNNIKQRISQLKGTFNIDTAINRGTTYNIQIPI